MGIRKNVLTLSPTEVGRLTNAFNALKADGTYNGFVERHARAMMMETPPGASNTDRNAAHRGPSFLPWHRAALVELADALRQVDPQVEDIPYWDWTADAALPGGPATSTLWTNAYFGPDGDPNQGDRVLSGPFANWRAWIYRARTDSFQSRSSVGLVRRLGRTRTTVLPTQAVVNDLLNNYQVYDVSPWDETRNTRSFRNRVEGWYRGSVLHNQVHNWIAGDMTAMTSPNDPVFWLHHCNVDRLWAQWQESYGVNTYAPTSGGPDGHNKNDALVFLLDSWTPADVLNIADLGYSYE